MQSIHDQKTRKKGDAIGAGVEGNLKGLDQRARRSLSRMDLQTRFERSVVNLSGSGDGTERGGWQTGPILAANKLGALV